VKVGAELPVPQSAGLTVAFSIEKMPVSTSETTMTESFADLFAQSLAETRMKPGTIVQGTVVEVRPDFIIVNAGLKSEGVIPAEQFRNARGEIEIAVGISLTSPSMRSKTVSAKPASRARKPSAPRLGTNSRKPVKLPRPSPA